MHRIHQSSNETMKRMPMPILPISSSSIQSGTNTSVPDLLWISKQQQQHPSTHAHPLKNTIRISSNGIRYKFDGKQWRPLCESSDGHECRNLAFRSSLCQKHFYKIHLFKRPYGKNGNSSISASEMPPLALKRTHSYEHQHHNHCHRDMYDDNDDDDSIQVIEQNDSMMIKQDNIETNHDYQPEIKIFTIDCDQQSDLTKHEINPPESKTFSKMNRLDSTNNEFESTSLNVSLTKLNESIHFGIPPLTRTEEKSLANELITQLPADVSFTMAEQMAHRRASEIVMDNYSNKIPSIHISPDWFYDFLLRNPRVPIHFQSWFSSIKPTLPLSDLLIDIKIWELGLITRSVIPSSSFSSSSASP